MLDEQIFGQKGENGKNGTAASAKAEEWDLSQSTLLEDRFFTSVKHSQIRFHDNGLK